MGIIVAVPAPVLRAYGSVAVQQLLVTIAAVLPAAVLIHQQVWRRRLGPKSALQGPGDQFFRHGRLDLPAERRGTTARDAKSPHRATACRLDTNEKPTLTPGNDHGLTEMAWASALRPMARIYPLRSATTDKNAGLLLYACYSNAISLCALL